MAQELLSGKESREWIDDVKLFVNALNKNAEKRKPEPEPKEPIAEPCSNKLLEIGVRVRLQLDEPMNVATGKKLPGKFRSTDIKWDPKIRTIRQVLLKPGFPPMYLLDKNNGSGPQSIRVDTVHKRFHYLINIDSTFG